MFEFLKSIFSWLTAKQETKTADLQDKTAKDQNKNLFVQQTISQINANNFWLVLVETYLALIFVWNTTALNFGWPIFQTQFDDVQLLLYFCGIQMVKIGHRYSVK